MSCNLPQLCKKNLVLYGSLQICTLCHDVFICLSVSATGSTGCIKTASSSKSSQNSLHVCTACSKTFAQRYKLSKHIIHTHKELDVTIVCPRVRHRSVELAPSCICSTCGMGLSNSANLKKHIGRRHANIDVESICQRKLSANKKICVVDVLKHIIVIMIFETTSNDSTKISTLILPPL